MKRIRIVGGGITGLTCAYRLARAGHEVVVYEKSDSMGGLASSFRSGDFIFDYGPHEFCTQNPLLVSTLKDVLGDDMLVLEKKASQYFNGQFINYPLTPVEVVQRFGPAMSARILSEVVAKRLQSLVYSYSDHSFERWVESRFGKTLYRQYFGPFTQKVWGIDPDQLDPRTASSRISFNSIFDFVIKTTAYYLLHKDDYSSIHSPLKNSFYYSRRGIGTLTKKLAERCLQAGVEFRSGFQLRQADISDDRVRALRFDNGYVDESFDYVVSTIPVTGLLQAIGELRAKVPIRFRSMVFVFLEIPLEQMSPYSWIYFPDTDIIFQRSTEFSYLKADMNPPGQTGVGLEISCFPDDPIWNERDENIARRVRQDLHRVGLLDEDVPCRANVVRKQFIYPIQIIGYLEMVHELLAPVRRLSNAVSTGRQGLYKYCNMNECMEMAIAVAEQIEAGADRFRYELDSRWLGAGLETERVMEGPAQKSR